MAYDDEFKPEVDARERIATAVGDARDLLTKPFEAELLHIVLGPKNYRRLLEYLDCIDKNNERLRPS